jgi:uncharacterized Fe-S cluster-containing MiaB family protein
MLALHGIYSRIARDKIKNIYFHSHTEFIPVSVIAEMADFQIQQGAIWWGRGAAPLCI